MVTITASYIVTPNQETPSGQLWLSESDQVTRWGHTPLIYIYDCDYDDDVTERLRDSLSKVLVPYHPLAGRLAWAEGGRLVLDCNASGAALLEAKSTKTMTEYGDFSPKESIKELIPAIDYSQPLEELPLFLAQVTRFRDDQGIAIGVAFSHPLCDGLSSIRFMNAWAKIARRGMLDEDEMPFLDRTLLKFPSPLPSSPRFDHVEFKPMPLKIGSSDSATERKKKTTAVLLKLRSEHVERLKKRANNGRPYKQGSSRPYSRFEAIGAYLWKCASMARRLDKNQPTVIRFNVDYRSRLSPPLPKNYVGNALAPTLTPKCCVGDVVSKPLSYGAQKIREAVEMMTNEYIRSQLDFIKGQQQLDLFRPFFNEKEEQQVRDVPFYGNPNFNLTSWMSFPVYEADFGWGKPFYFGPGSVCPYDRATISLSRDGDVLVFMYLQMEHMEDFIKFFWEYICDDGMKCAL